MRDLTEAEKKTFRRLRRAYRRALFTALNRRAPVEEMRQITMRITARAIELGWLESPPDTMAHGRAIP